MSENLLRVNKENLWVANHDSQKKTWMSSMKTESFILQLRPREVNDMLKVTSWSHNTRIQILCSKNMPNKKIGCCVCVNDQINRRSRYNYSSFWSASIWGIKVDLCGKHISKKKELREKRNSIKRAFEPDAVNSSKALTKH